MSSTVAGIVFVVALALALAAVYRPFGDYMYRAVTGKRHLRAERVMYRLVRVNPDSEQSWGVYARSVLAFAARLGAVPVRVPAGAVAPVAQPGLPERSSRRWPGTPPSSFVDQHQLAELLGRVDDGPPRPDGRAGGAELRVRGRGHRGRGRAGARVRPHADRPAGQLLGRPDPDLDPGAAADLPARGLGRVHRRRHGAEPARQHRTSTTLAGQPPVDHRRSGRLPGGDQGVRAPTAAASTTPTPRTRSRTRPPTRTGSRSSCC